MTTPNHISGLDGEFSEMFRDFLGISEEEEAKAAPIPLPDYANDPNTHTCPGCRETGSIAAFHGSNGIIGPGGRSWVEMLVCKLCGIHFSDAPKNRRSIEDIESSKIHPDSSEPE